MIPSLMVQFSAGSATLGIDGIVVALAAVFLFAAVRTDLRDRIIPNRIPLALAGLWLCRLPVAGLLGADGAALLDSAFAGLLGALVIGGGLLAFTLLFERVTGRASMGGGDIKLMAACALYLGVQRGALCLALSCALGVALAAIIPRTRFARPDERAAMPFAPAIAAATLIMLLI